MPQPMGLTSSPRRASHRWSDGPRVSVVGEDGARPDEHAVLHRHAVVDEGAVLDLHPVADLHALIDEDVPPDDALGTDLRPGRTCARCQMSCRADETSSSRSADAWTRALGSITMARGSCAGRGRARRPPGDAGRWLSIAEGPAWTVPARLSDGAGRGPRRGRQPPRRRARHASRRGSARLRRPGRQSRRRPPSRGPSPPGRRSPNGRTPARTGRSRRGRPGRPWLSRISRPIAAPIAPATGIFSAGRADRADIRRPREPPPARARRVRVMSSSADSWRRRPADSVAAPAAAAVAARCWRGHGFEPSGRGGGLGCGAASVAVPVISSGSGGEAGGAVRPAVWARRRPCAGDLRLRRLGGELGGRLVGWLMRHRRDSGEVRPPAYAERVRHARAGRTICGGSSGRAGSRSGRTHLRRIVQSTSRRVDGREPASGSASRDSVSPNSTLPSGTFRPCRVIRDLRIRAQPRGNVRIGGPAPARNLSATVRSLGDGPQRGQAPVRAVSVRRYRKAALWRRGSASSSGSGSMTRRQGPWRQARYPARGRARQKSPGRRTDVQAVPENGARRRDRPRDRDAGVACGNTTSTPCPDAGSTTAPTGSSAVAITSRAPPRPRPTATPIPTPTRATPKLVPAR